MRDDVGQAVDLKHVEDDVTAAQVVGQWVVASGNGVLLPSGRLVGLDQATIGRVDDPAATHLDNAVIDAYAKLSAECRRAGHGLQDNRHTGDRWVAACAIPSSWSCWLATASI